MVVTSQVFESFAQNAEDVVLWRALGPVVAAGVGRYIDVGANDPMIDSISWAFYLRGWRGITAEPVPSLVDAHRTLRPHDRQVEAVIGDLETDEVVLHEIAHSGLSTIRPEIAGKHSTDGWEVQERTVPVRRLNEVLAEAGWDDGRDIHFMTVDTEGAELAVLASIDLRRYRPWVLVVEATAPTSSEQTHAQWEHLVLGAGYVLCLFDGLSRFYVAQEHKVALAGRLGYPACSLDTFSDLPRRTLNGERDRLAADLQAAQDDSARWQHRLALTVQETVRWRTAALQRWNDAVGQASATHASSEVVRVRAELDAIRQTVSWRVTRPLRTARSLAASGPAAPVLRWTRSRAGELRPRAAEARTALRAELIAVLPNPTAQRLRALRQRRSSPSGGAPAMTAPDVAPSKPLNNLVRVQRLRAVAEALLGLAPGPVDPTTGPAEEFAVLLDQMVGSLQANPAPDRTWLLMVALSGRFPTDDELRGAVRTFELADRIGATLWLLEDSLQAARQAGTADWPIELVKFAVVVDVDYSAQHDLHSGIQRVVRTVLPRWSAARQVVPVAWTWGHQALRPLSAGERNRVLQWGGNAPRANDDAPRTLVVPWRSTIVLLEVPAREACERLAAVGQWSGNRVVAVGYDCIPIVSAGLVPLAEPNRFVHYLTAVKYMAAVAGISVSATSEFRGFAQMLPSQGLVGPDVTECALPVEHFGIGPTAPAAAHPDGALVLCVGSFEPRKNQLAVLWAAEMLWREGLVFRLRFVGAGGWGTEFPRAVRHARRSGRPVEVLTAVSDAALDESYRSARFSVFVSVHEGYGLPVAESLARSTPVLITNYGSVREIGADGGTLPVDPRDDLAVLQAMRRLLLDDDLVEDLRGQIARRPERSWDDYATDLWSALRLSGPLSGPPEERMLHV